MPDTYGVCGGKVSPKRLKGMVKAQGKILRGELARGAQQIIQDKITDKMIYHKTQTDQRMIRTDVGKILHTIR